MGTSERFNEIFGLGHSVDDERDRFVQRVNQVIFCPIDTEQWVHFDYVVLFELVCFELGVNAHTFPPRRLGRLNDTIIPTELTTLTRNDFGETLRVLCVLYEHIGLRRDSKQGREWLSDRIKAVLSRCACGIGVTWKDGFFYPAEAEELGQPLIEDTLTWLRDYPSEEKDYRTALRGYMAGDSLADVIKNCYSAVEGVARNVLGNQKTLDNNKDELLAKVDLSDGWKSLLANYIKYAHDYRHAFAERHEIKKQEAEAYLYMTGLIIRLLIESKGS